MSHGPTSRHLRRAPPQTHHRGQLSAHSRSPSHNHSQVYVTSTSSQYPQPITLWTYEQIIPRQRPDYTRTRPRPHIHCDRYHDREVSPEEGRGLAHTLGQCGYLKTSVKHAGNMEDAFSELVRRLRGTTMLERAHQLGGARPSTMVDQSCDVNGAEGSNALFH
ncbi:hypothetical protein BD779DRAFT_1011645 [Infundibulicybe gibba]|nr:hypothetical protein BD779DRAFT_1011645 [Infundibulicybe gibba]